MYSLLFCFHDKTPRPEKLKEEKVYFGLWFQRDRSPFIAILVRNMAAGRQAWHWSSSRELTSGDRATRQRLIENDVYF